jgi:hypothetical protein
VAFIFQEAMCHGRYNLNNMGLEKISIMITEYDIPGVFHCRVMEITPFPLSRC